MKTAAAVVLVVLGVAACATGSAVDAGDGSDDGANGGGASSGGASSGNGGGSASSSSGGPSSGASGSGASGSGASSSGGASSSSGASSGGASSSSGASSGGTSSSSGASSSGASSSGGTSSSSGASSSSASSGGGKDAGPANACGVCDRTWTCGAASDYWQTEGADCVDTRTGTALHCNGKFDQGGTTNLGTWSGDATHVALVFPNVGGGTVTVDCYP